MTQESDINQLDQLKLELEKREEEAKAKGLPFNQTAYLRRMTQNKNQYYDSAEYVLKNGWPQTQKKAAYFEGQEIQSHQPTKPSGASRFQAKVQEEDDDDQ